MNMKESAQEFRWTRKHLLTLAKCRRALGPAMLHALEDVAGAADETEAVERAEFGVDPGPAAAGFGIRGFTVTAMKTESENRLVGRNGPGAGKQRHEGSGGEHC